MNIDKAIEYLNMIKDKDTREFLERLIQFIKADMAQSNVRKANEKP